MDLSYILSYDGYVCVQLDGHQPGCHDSFQMSGIPDSIAETSGDCLDSSLSVYTASPQCQLGLPHSMEASGQFDFLCDDQVLMNWPQKLHSIIPAHSIGYTGPAQIHCHKYWEAWLIGDYSRDMLSYWDI